MSLGKDYLNECRFEHDRAEEFVDILYNKEFWMTADGNKMLIKNMETSHIRNVLNLIDKGNEVEIEYGSDGGENSVDKTFEYPLISSLKKELSKREKASSPQKETTILDFPEMESHQDEDGWRWYKDKISVTTVLKQAVANPKLDNWKIKNSAKKVYDTVNKAADFGTKTHEIFEGLLRGQQVVVSDEQKHLVAPIESFLTTHKVKPQNLEFTVFSEQHGYAGRVDFLGEIDGKLVLADWKTSNHYNITFGWQLGAYRMALKELLGVEPGMMVVKINKQTGEITKFEYEHFDYVEHKFLCALEIMKGLNFNKLKKMNWKWLEKRSV